MQKSRWRRGVLHSRHARSSDGLSVTPLRQRRRRRRGAAWHPQGGPYGIQNLEPFDLKSCLSQTGQGFGASIRVQIAENELPIFYIKWSREAGIMYPLFKWQESYQKRVLLDPPLGSKLKVDFFWILPGRGSKISILGQVSKPSSKRTEIISFATLSGDLKGGAHDPVIFDPFALNG